MDYLDYLWVKAGLLVLAAFVWGIFCGLNGRNLRWEPLDRGEPPER
jgi:hypothetical protein